MYHQSRASIRSENKKIWTTAVAIALLCSLSELVMPWWIIAVISFAMPLASGLRPGQSFLAGFCGVGFCWLIFALVGDFRNNHILSARMAEMFHLPAYGYFIAVTVLLGALTGGMSASIGALIIRKR